MTRVACPICGGSCRTEPRDSAYCGRCFLTFRPSDPDAALVKRRPRAASEALAAAQLAQSRRLGYRDAATRYDPNDS